MKNSHATKPLHVGFIPDGIRRWSKLNSISELEAYLLAMKKIDDIVNTIFELGAETLSVYVLSKDNLKRSDDTLKTIFYAESLFFKELLPVVAKKWNAKVNYAGLIQNIPSDEYRSTLKTLVDNTKNNTEREIILCTGYDPIEELDYAFSKSKESGKHWFEFLWVTKNLDLIIRTGKENRISKFLPLQACYAEIYFVNKLFLDIENEDIHFAFDFFANKARRFGA